MSFEIGCTTVTTTLPVVSTTSDVVAENVDRVCICNKIVSFDIRNKETNKKSRVNYKILKAKKEFIAGMEEVYLSVVGEGISTPGALNFFMSRKYPESEGFLFLRGKLWRGLAFTADYEAETTSCH
jgi:hypothetical protein